MAIDTTIFAVDIPAGTYAAGDVVPLVCTDGPANVRSGRGAAKLKTICTMRERNTAPYWRIHVKNSDWIDDVQSMCAASTNAAATMFDDEAGGIQGGHDCDLTPNSGWQVYAECIIGGTSTVADSLFCLLDVDYPQVGGVTDPRKAVGYPTSIPYDIPAIASYAYGNAVGATWTAQSVDYLKAGYKYVLDAVEVTTDQAALGFIAFSNAAGMGGLTRIIPFTSTIGSIRYPVKYSSVLVKGPMEVKCKVFQANAATIAVETAHDYVKQKA